MTYDERIKFKNLLAEGLTLDIDVTYEENLKVQIRFEGAIICESEIGLHMLVESSHYH